MEVQPIDKSYIKWDVADTVPLLHNQIQDNGLKHRNHEQVFDRAGCFITRISCRYSDFHLSLLSRNFSEQLIIQ
jgi:hypothetical protein